MDAASELVEEAFRWLQEHYDSFSFYQERDLVWTIQSHLVAEIRRRDLDLRVWNDYPMFRQGRRSLRRVRRRGLPLPAPRGARR